MALTILFGQIMLLHHSLHHCNSKEVGRETAFACFISHGLLLQNINFYIGIVNQ